MFCLLVEFRSRRSTTHNPLSPHVEDVVQTLQLLGRGKPLVGYFVRSLGVTGYRSVESWSLSFCPLLNNRWAADPPRALSTIEYILTTGSKQQGQRIIDEASKTESKETFLFSLQILVLKEAIILNNPRSKNSSLNPKTSLDWHMHRPSLYLCMAKWPHI